MTAPGTTDRRLARVLADTDARRVVLAGPGVLHTPGALGGLRSLAAAGNLGVANTWGAKGVFAWDSPHHLGTVGLQADDFSLLGFGAVDVILATGVDRLEVRGGFSLSPVRHIAPGELAGLALETLPSAATMPANNLYARLSAIAQPGYVDDKVPLHPARAVREVGNSLAPGGLVTATPGVAGLWVARTFPTPALGAGDDRRVVVPAKRWAGEAVRPAIDAALAGRPTVVVTTGPAARTVLRLIARAADAPAPLVLVTWSPDGPRLAPDEYSAQLTSALATPGVTTVDVAVALEDTQCLVEAAGRVVAWGGLGA